MAWIAYRLQLWPGLRYRLGTMTNDIEEATSVNSKTDYRMLNILGVARTVTVGLRTLHTTFRGFGLLSVATEQLICRINMLLQHYHTSTNLSRKLEASLKYLQLQLGTPHNPITLDYDKWRHLALSVSHRPYAMMRRDDRRKSGLEYLGYLRLYQHPPTISYGEAKWKRKNGMDGETRKNLGK
jgi:hypothetical protein